MKKILITVFIVISVVSVSFAKAAEEKTNVNLAVMQGPTGFSSVMLPDYINISVYPSPNEAVAKLVNGELNMAVLPANTAANLYNKGIGIKALAVLGEGMLSVIGTNPNAKTISVPGAGGTPDHMATLLYPEYERSYSVSAPAQLAQLIIAGKCELAILPQPFVNMVLSKNSNVRVIRNVQDDWKNTTGESGYPMSILVVNADYAAKNPKVVEQVKKDYRKSIESVMLNIHDAALKIEEKGIMKADLAEAAIADCAIVFSDGAEAKREIESYYRILYELAPAAIGSALPDSGYYTCL